MQGDVTHMKAEHEVCNYLLYFSLHHSDNTTLSNMMSHISAPASLDSKREGQRTVQVSGRVHAIGLNEMSSLHNAANTAVPRCQQ